MSTCSACLWGTVPTPASAAWISQGSPPLWPPPGTILLTVTTAGLMPQTSHILLVAISLTSLWSTHRVYSLLHTGDPPRSHWQPPLGSAPRVGGGKDRKRRPERRQGWSPPPLFQFPARLPKPPLAVGASLLAV